MPRPALACMGPEVLVLPFFLVLGWVFVLALLEIYLIRKHGKFQQAQACEVYIYLLAAKLGSVIGIYPFFDHMAFIEYGQIDLLYFFIHALLSAILIRVVYHKKGAELWMTSLLISTIVPLIFKLPVILLSYWQ